MTTGGSMMGNHHTPTGRHVGSQLATWPGAWDLLSRDALQARGWKENKYGDRVVSLSIVIKSVSSSKYVYRYSEVEG